MITPVIGIQKNRFLRSGFFVKSMCLPFRSCEDKCKSAPLGASLAIA
jgi:hypothetical protein